MKYTEIENLESFQQMLQNQSQFKHLAFQNIDFTKLSDYPSNLLLDHCLFLGCQIPEKLTNHLENALIFPKMDMPYNTYPNRLYTQNDLYDTYIPGKPESYQNTLDQRIYRHFIKTGKQATDIKETLARRLHDHSITDAIDDFLAQYNEKQVVAFMGGHGLLRSDPDYYKIAQISKTLTEEGYLMVSGGGPGAMEATHVGAWLAGKTNENLKQAIEILKKAPGYKHPLWLDTAFEVLQLFPESTYKSLGIPTWLYGHEPPTPFASHIGKYFANSVREDGLLTIAKGGIIFAPGSAGTIQEIFQEATQNHYLSFGYASPMIFMGEKYWTIDKPVYSCLRQLQQEGKYQNLLLTISDQPEMIISEIVNFTYAQNLL